MKIARTAIQNFLNEPRESHTWMKDLPEERIDAMIQGLEPRPSFSTPLNLHQKVCFLLSIAYPQFFHILGMGSGKTYLSLAILRYLLQGGLIRHAWVLVPTDEVAYTWENQIALHTPDLPYVPLLGSTERKWELFDEMQDGIALVTYSGLAWMVCDLIPKKKGKGKELTPNQKRLLRVSSWAHAMVLDESVKIGNHQSLFYRCTNKISQFATYRILLSGRPFGRDPTPLWAQFHILDHGLTLGPTLGLFRAAFFTEKDNWFSGFPEYKFDRRMEPELSRMIQHRSIHYRSDECISLPQVVYIKKVVRFPEQTELYYKRIVKEVIAARGSYREVQNAFLRLRQVSSGYLGFKDEETDERAEVEFDHNPKLALLMEMLDEIDEKAIVFHDFNWSGRRISDELKKAKIKHGWIWGKAKGTREMLDRFRSDPDYRVMVLSAQKAAIGIDGLQVAPYCFFYESPVDPSIRQQAEARVARQGQQASRVFIIDLVVKDSADEKILGYHREGKNLFRALVENPEQLLF
jgi:SNF2 family DNA or RNA helicase